MNQSPNSLKDVISISNNLNAINIIGYNDKNYVTKSNLLSFIKENNVESIDGVISIINEFCDVKDVSIISESESDQVLRSINEVMYILEAIDPDEVITTSKGPSMLKEYINRAAAFIVGHEYDKADELKSEIQKCDKVLKDISEERSKAKDKNKSSSYKFTLTYIYHLAKIIFDLFIAPFIIVKSVKWPAWVTNFTNKLPFVKKAVEAKKSTGMIGKLNKLSKSKPAKLAATADKAIDVGMPEDIKGLYLSFKDYDALLVFYQKKIEDIRSNLQSQLNSMEASNKEIVKENAKMYKLEEEVISPSAAEVHYISPEELRGKPEHREVFHDDGDELETSDSEPEKVEPVTPPIPEEEPEIVSPIDIINKAKANPSNVMVTKYNDKYYIGHDDLKGYMHACDNDDYDDAVKCIAKSHADDPDFKPECVKVVMGSSELDNCTPEEKAKLESACVEFEIYSDN